MDETTIEGYKKKLEAMREKENESARKIRDGLRSTLMDSVGELSLYDNHPADVGDVTFEREKDLGLKLFAEDRLHMIDDALERINKGEYGLCESCRHRISAERLEAIPFTKLCRECKKEHEGSADFHRPVEESVINPPYGNVNNDSNTIDGEDIWQAVARFGTSNSPPDLQILGEE